MIGQGQFGKVRLAQDLASGEKVAIKSVRKKDMKYLEVLQLKREVDVLRIV